MDVNFLNGNSNQIHKDQLMLLWKHKYIQSIHQIDTAC